MNARDRDKDALRRDMRAIIDELEAAGTVVANPRNVQCPWRSNHKHGDRNASAELIESADGIWRFRCHGGACGFYGDVFDIRDKRLGLEEGTSLKELMAPHANGTQRRENPPKAADVAPKSKEGGQSKIHPTLDSLKRAVEWATKGKIERIYPYSNPDTHAKDLIVFRVKNANGSKTFMQSHQVEGGYVLKAPPHPWPLYNRIEIRQHEEIHVFEGEKCAECVRQMLKKEREAGAEIGFTATTAPGGAGKAQYVDWSPLKGKRVYLWEDNDDAGRKHMQDVAAILYNMDRSNIPIIVRAEYLPLEEKEDIYDLLAKTPAEQRYSYFLQARDLASDPYEPPPTGLQRIIRDTIDGKRRNEPWQWVILTRETRALLPGTITLLCGTPGATKSLMLLQTAIFWHEQGIKTAIYELEENKAFHEYRALAIKVGDSRVLDDSWVRQNAKQMLEIEASYRSWIQRFGDEVICEAPDKDLSFREVTRWVKAKAESGHRIICIDPITAIDVTDAQWAADQKFMRDLRNITSQHQCSVILVTHPKKGSSASIMDDMAGGAAFQRFSQCVLWLEHHPTPVQSLVNTGMGLFSEEHNRTMRVLKARNAKGGGMGIAMNFDPETLQIRELGAIIDPAKKPKKGKLT